MKEWLGQANPITSVYPVKSPKGDIGAKTSLIGDIGRERVKE
jgi:hypothetical protein